MKPEQCLLHLLRCLQATLKKRLRPVNGAVYSRGGNVLQRDIKPVHRGDGGDITPHCSGPNDVNMRHAMITTPTLFHCVCQLEIAPHSRRCRRHHKFRK